ncbi:MAG: hypothetical protein RR877_00105 [Aurantimicrobium sp.]|uniref:hypothetical protein n=1 Tax=Aurantimicrobium sp. TaxID=1930784 RepID=UPI002FC691C8
MTKKSYGRMQRDLQEAKTKSAQKMRADYFKKNTGWDDAKELYDSNCRMVIGTGETIRQGYSDKNIFRFFNSQETIEVNAAINGMNKDLQMFADELARIGQQHISKTGQVTSDDDFNFILELGQSYSDFATRFSAVVSQNQRFLTDKLGIALGRRQEAEAAAAQAAAQDVNVVTDVEAKPTEEKAQ